MISTRSVWFLVLCTVLASGPTLALEHTVIRLGGTGSAAATFKQLGDAFHKTRPDIEIRFIPNLGSSGAIKALQAGTLELALSARNLKSHEQPLREQELGRTPLVIAVALTNPTDRISLDELARILSANAYLPSPAASP